MSESVPLNQRAARRESAVVGEPVEVRAVSIDAAVQRQFEAYFRSPLRGGRFQNPWPHQIRRSALDVLRWRLQRPPASRRRGAAPVPVHDAALADFARLDTPGRLLWLGHATFHVEIDGVPFMIDPIFGPVAGIIRRVSPLPVALPRLPSPRVVLLTHGHADHMDRRSLELLCEQADRELAFIVPLRLSRWLPKACRQVIELSWWESVRIDGVEFMLVPAQHWHRRGLTDEDECLWGGLRGARKLFALSQR